MVSAVRSPLETRSHRIEDTRSPVRYRQVERVRDAKNAIKTKDYTGTKVPYETQSAAKSALPIMKGKKKKNEGQTTQRPSPNVTNETPQKMELTILLPIVAPAPKIAAFPNFLPNFLPCSPILLPPSPSPCCPWGCCCPG